MLSYEHTHTHCGPIALTLPLRFSIAIQQSALVDIVETISTQRTNERIGVRTKEPPAIGLIYSSLCTATDELESFKIHRNSTHFRRDETTPSAIAATANATNTVAHRHAAHSLSVRPSVRPSVTASTGLYIRRQSSNTNLSQCAPVTITTTTQSPFNRLTSMTLTYTMFPAPPVCSLDATDQIKLLQILR